MKYSANTFLAATRVPLTILGGLLAATLFMAGAGAGETVSRKIVLIGGVKSEGPGRHDYPNGIRLFRQFLESSPDAKQVKGLVIASFPDGWPADPAALNDASTIVWYFDGLENHPLLDPARRAQFDGLMSQGVGLVALHQASTVPPGADVIGLTRWLGGARIGMFDRTDEMVEFKPAPNHPVSRGVETFTYFDEFYPTIHFGGAGKLTPVLKGRLHPQFREGRHLVIDKPTLSSVAWAFERNSGGRSFGFTGGHFLASLDEAPLRMLLLNAIFWTAGIEVPKQGVRSGLADAATKIASGIASAMADVPRKGEPVIAVAAASGPMDITTFHVNPQRTGWLSRGTTLTPTNVAAPGFGRLWESPTFDSLDGAPPRAYASPLYIDKVTLSMGPHRGTTLPVVFAATSNGFVYAVNATETADIAPGTILWRAQLGKPCRLEPTPLDGISTGVLSTPVIDIARKRLYVTSCEHEKRWRAHALALDSGDELAGWPVVLDETTFNLPGMNRNAGSVVPPPKRFDYRVQRGALNLSPDKKTLYVTFGETQTGWLIAVDTDAAKVASAFASVANPHRGSGGIWGAGGPAVDAEGNVFVVTGTGYSGYVDAAHNWAQSVLKLSYAQPQGFVLRGTYTPFNYCDTATRDIDLGSGGAALMPDREANATTTPQLMTVGGKQGNVYLLDHARMPGGSARRQPCSKDSASDRSLLAPDSQPQFGQRGPLNVFGPYTDKDAAIDTARGRSVPAYFQDGAGAMYVFVTGSTKKVEASAASVPPSLARLKLMVASGKPAYLVIDQFEQTVVFENPGSPVVSSNGAADAIVWVLDSHARRSAPLLGDQAPKPVLYAFDALNFKLLWKSNPGELSTSGKYNGPAVAGGRIFVATDRIQTFGLRSATLRSDSINGQAIYRARCAICHDQAEGRVPPKEIIASRSHQHIVDTLTNGIMRAQATGLSAASIAAVAQYLKQSASGAL